MATESDTGSMVGGCPSRAGTLLTGGPADLYGFFWYLGVPTETCDETCAHLDGENLALEADNAGSLRSSGRGRRNHVVLSERQPPRLGIVQYRYDRAHASASSRKFVP